MVIPSSRVPAQLCRRMLFRLSWELYLLLALSLLWYVPFSVLKRTGLSTYLQYLIETWGRRRVCSSMINAPLFSLKIHTVFAHWFVDGSCLLTHREFTVLLSCHCFPDSL
jgi:hypothetical protein